LVLQVARSILSPIQSRLEIIALLLVNAGAVTGVFPRRIDQSQRVVPDIRIHVPGLRVFWMLARTNLVGTHESAHLRGVVAGPEIIEVGFGISFFAGEFVLTPVSNPPLVEPEHYPNQSGRICECCQVPPS
jgi:hypothetical protein